MYKSLFLSLAVASTAFASCEPASPANCNLDTCSTCHCLGPVDIIANAPVNPKTCDGDIVISAAVLYWKASQDGMEYAIEDSIFRVTSQRVLIDADFMSPNSKNDFGLRFGLEYISPCDGWNLSVKWTSFQGKASSHDLIYYNPDSAQSIENRDLLAIWSAFQGYFEGFTQANFCNNITTDWCANFNLLDLNLGRVFWTSRKLSFYPFIGLRYARIDQSFDLLQRGGSWAEDINNQPPYQDEVELRNDFEGIGVASGFGMNWHFGCGWSIISMVSTSIAYGHFSIRHDEQVREVQSPFAKQKVLETENAFRASRPILDLALGIEYASLICDSKYGVSLQLAWEKHLFFDQNQLWRVNRVAVEDSINSFPDNNGKNVFYQRRGTLGTSGLTFSFQFAF